jgi:isopenicillin N synthase-like dioxygenase
MTKSPRSLDPFVSLPIVDVSALVDSDSARLEETVAALRRAASDVGFLYVTGHAVPAERIAALEKFAHDFFELPAAAKLEYYIGRSKNHRGYVPPGEEVFYSQTKDTKEAFDLCRELPDLDYGPASRLLGPNVWPHEIPGFRDGVMAYYEDVFALGRALLGGFALALDLPRSYFDAFLQRPPSQLRLIHYEPSAPGADTMGIGAHTDYECLTILHATAPGLQVINGAGRWVAAPPIPGAFVVNIGDLLEVWSNGVFISTSHRVLPVAADRYSFPLFFTVDYETRVEPLPHLSREGTRYTPLVSGEHLLSQTMQSFRYLIELRERGVLTLPDGSRELSSFGRERQSP